MNYFRIKQKRRYDPRVLAGSGGAKWRSGEAARYGREWRIRRTRHLALETGPELRAACYRIA